MTDSKQSCISHLLTLNNMKYSVGLFSKEGLFVKEEWLFSIHKNENGGYDRFEYNLRTNELKMSKKENEESEFISIDISDIESNCVIDISNDGMRWEGSCKNHSPFGHVCLMNESNELIYQGVIINDHKECFGIEFYPDLGQIEYIGSYWNNDRHGYGMLYDRKGELVYEGDWLCGSNEYERSVILKVIDNDRMVHSLTHELVIDDEYDSDDSYGFEYEGDWLYDSNEYERSVVLKDTDNERMVHSLIHELIIDEGVGNDYKDDLLLCGFANLEKVVVKENSFQNLNCLKISDNCVLKSIEIEDGEWDDDTGTGSFANVKTAILASDFVIS